jgi:NAD(P) transhydrogenase subunit alpha
MEPSEIANGAARAVGDASSLVHDGAGLADKADQVVIQVGQAVGLDPFIIGLTVFVLAVVVGYYVIWGVTPALHSPLMSVTNAISSVIIVGALIAAGPLEIHFSKVMGLLAVTLASVNIFGGFIVTQRMLRMFRKAK